MLRFGPETGPVVIAALPLFDEANRTRAFTVSVLRALADRGIASVLPDLPGTGESLVRTEHLSMRDLRDAYASVAELIGDEGQRPYAIGIRSGALIDCDASAHGRWHLAPQSGADLVRDLGRIRSAQLHEVKPRPDAGLLPNVGEDHVTVAGNAIPVDFLSELERCEPFDQPENLRVVRLTTDPKPANVKLAGIALWRKAEPDNDLPFAQAVADDIASWIVTCEK